MSTVSTHKETFERQFVYELHSLYGSLSKYFEKKFAEHNSLSFSQFWIVHCFLCAESSKRSQSDIARVMFLTEATVSRHIESLEKLGVLTRAHERNNKRSYRVRITAKGKRLHASAEQILNTELARLFSSVSDTDRAPLLAALQTITTNIHSSV